MNRPNISLLLCLLVLALATTGCSIQTSKSEDGKNEKVDIETPLGSLKLNTEPDAADLGLPLYPGARRVKNSEHGDSVNLSFGTDKFGFKAVAIHLESDDPTDKVASFYRPELEKKGKVEECKGNIDIEDKDNNDKFRGKIKCEENDSGEIGMAVVAGAKHHVISIKPKGSGSEITLLYLQTRQESEMM